MPRKVEISHKTIVFTTLFILGLVFVYFIRDIILKLFIAILLMTILEPIVNGFTKIKIPRSLSILLTYILLISFFIGALALVIPALVEQTSSFVNAFPAYIEHTGVLNQSGFDVLKNSLATTIGIPQTIFQFTFSIFSNIASVITVLVFTFYFLLIRGKLDNQLDNFFGEEKSRDIAHTIEMIENKLGGWARGEIILMTMVALGNFIGLTLIGIPYALPLAVLSGILEIVPVLGPVLSAVPSIIIGFGISPFIGFGAAAVALIVQQLENYVLVPKVMEKSVGVSPIIILIALSVGAKLAGIVGVIISVPTVITLQVILKKYLIKD